MSSPLLRRKKKKKNPIRHGVDDDAPSADASAAGASGGAALDGWETASNPSSRNPVERLNGRVSAASPPASAASPRPSAAASAARRPSLDSPAGDLGEMGWLDRLGEQYPAPGSGGSGDE